MPTFDDPAFQQVLSGVQGAAVPFTPSSPAMTAAPSGAGGSDPVSSMLSANPGMQPWVAQAFVQNGITPTGRGGGAGDWQYWQTNAMQGANGDTGYLAGRIAQAAGGGGGGGQAAPQGGTAFDPSTLMAMPQTGWSAPAASNPNISNFGYSPLTAPTPLSIANPQAPNTITPQSVSNAPVTAAQMGAAPTVTGPGTLTAQTLANPNAFSMPADFTTDPSYQFRLKQGENALQTGAAAKGLLSDTGTLQGLEDYAQNSASQEYQNAFARNFQTSQAQTQNQLAYTQANNAALAQAFGLTGQFGLQAQEANQAAGLQTGQTNAQLQQQANLANSGQGLQAALANQGTNLSAQQYNAALQAQWAQQNFQNQFNLGQFNTNTGLTAQQQQYNQALNAWQANTGAQLQGSALANQYNLGMANVGLGYQNAANNFTLGQMQNALGYTQANNAFSLGMGGLGLGYANYGLNADQQNFNQGATLANMGLNAGAALGGFGSQYGANASNLITGAGNAAAAGTVGSANAWNSGFSGAANGISSAFLAPYVLQHPQGNG